MVGGSWRVDLWCCSGGTVAHISDSGVLRLRKKTPQVSSGRRHFGAKPSKLSMLRKGMRQGPPTVIQLDIILCPVGPGAAPPLDHSRYWVYILTWNLLDYLAMVFLYSEVD